MISANFLESHDFYNHAQCFVHVMMYYVLIDLSIIVKYIRGPTLNHQRGPGVFVVGNLFISTQLQHSATIPPPPPRVNGGSSPNWPRTC